jgi:DNA-binding HxlR family transcriptional regulator
MVKRTSLARNDCPIARALDIIGDWWSLLIIRDALLGRRRFGEFQKSLGLAKNILTTRLRTLVDRGILQLAPASDGSAYQEYVPTPKGRGIFPILVALRQWSEHWRHDAQAGSETPPPARDRVSSFRGTGGAGKQRQDHRVFAQAVLLEDSGGIVVEIEHRAVERQHVLGCDVGRRRNGLARDRFHVGWQALRLG